MVPNPILCSLSQLLSFLLLILERTGLVALHPPLLEISKERVSEMKVHFPPNLYLCEPQEPAGRCHLAAALASVSHTCRRVGS